LIREKPNQITIKGDAMSLSKQTITIITASCLLLAGMLIFAACGDDSKKTEESLGKSGIDLNTKVMDLDDSEKTKFCQWYIENTAMDKAASCTIDGSKIEYAAVTQDKCKENLDVVPNCTVKTYEDCAPVIKKDRCGFKYSDCPGLNGCQPPVNATHYCHDSSGNCSNTNANNITCTYELLSPLCVTAAVASFGIFLADYGINCTNGKVRSCSRLPGGICVIDSDSCK